MPLGRMGGGGLRSVVWGGHNAQGARLSAWISCNEGVHLINMKKTMITMMMMKTTNTIFIVMTIMLMTIMMMMVIEM